MWTPGASKEPVDSRHWLHDTSYLQDSRLPDITTHYLSLESAAPKLPNNPPRNPALTTESLERSLSLAQSLLKEHAHILEPLKTVLPRREDLKTPTTDLSNATTQVDNSPQSLAASPTFPLRSIKSFGSHRASHAIADATISTPPATKAMVARPPPGFNSPTHLSGSLAHRLSVAFEKVNASPPVLEAPPQMSLLSAGIIQPARSPSTARFAALHSPCCFHERFDEAVNLDRVLDEITSEDTGITHSRLMQTATSVREISKQLQSRPIKRAVRTIMIITKARDNSLVHLTRDLAEWLLLTPRYDSDVGVTVYVDAKLQKSKRFDAPSLLAKHPQMQHMLKYWTPDLCYTTPETFDLVLTLGGDGTVLFTSWLFQRIVPPILSFSLGSLGFLTNFQYADYKTHLNSLMGDRGMRVNLRMRFTCTIFRANRSSSKSKSKNTNGAAAQDPELTRGESFSVLNELVIDRGPSPYVSNLELYGDNSLLTIIQADGCIFSTPTGSTAYSLSAGGPLTHPEIPGIVLSPICPHTLSFRPMILSDSMLLRVCVPKQSRSTAYASFDGKGRVEFRRGDCVQVEAGRYPFPTVVGKEGAGGEWFESVRRALRWNNRGAVQKAFTSTARNTKEGGGMVADEEEEEDGALQQQQPKSSTQEDEGEGPVMMVSEDDEDEDEKSEEEEEWDIDVDPVVPISPTVSSSTASFTTTTTATTTTTYSDGDSVSSSTTTSQSDAGSVRGNYYPC